MSLFRSKRKLIIHETRMDGTYTQRDDKKTLIEHLFKDGIQRFPHLIFKGSPKTCSQKTQVQPSNKVEMLSNEGEYTLIETPGITGSAAVYLAYASIAISIASAAYAFYVASKYSASDTDSSSSSNRSLTARQNKERPMERIEDIAGTQRSYPTLVGPNYRKFNSSKIEIEYSLMCFGIGEFNISDVQDDETLISSIPNGGACFYAPHVMPGVSSNAFQTEGEAFNETVKYVTEASSVSGGETFLTEKDLRYDIADNEATAVKSESSSGSDIYWVTVTSDVETELMTDFGEVGDSVFFHDFKIKTNAGSEESMEGTYLIQGIGSYYITISAPDGGDVSDVVVDWDDVTADTSYDVEGDTYWRKTDYEDDLWLDEYFLPGDDRTEFWLNITAESGLQYDNGTSISVTVFVQYAQANSSGIQIGSWVDAGYITLKGSTTSRIGVTGEFATSFTGDMLMRTKRTTDYIGDAVLQDITLDAMFGSAAIGVSNFGNVTMVQTKTFAKGTAANLSTRYFNCLVTRKIPLVGSNGTIGTVNTATNRFIDYFAYAATSSCIGRRDQSEIDYQELYEQYVDIVNHFGDTQAGEFCYTFDDNDISFQDTADAICGAVFSTPIRQYGILSTKFEQPGSPRTLFNHRNKIPDSQTITRTFINDDYTDGIEYQWTDPDNDDAISTIYIPSDQSATRPELIESIGVRNYNQAYWNAYRRYNKINNQRISIEDTVTAEGQLLSQIDIVAITDDTKSTIYAGEVISVDGLTLYLNQPVSFVAGETHSISLRKRDGSIEIIGCTSGNDSFSIILNSTPSEAPYTDTTEDRTRFTFGADSDLGADYYIISEVDRSDPSQIKLTGYNYTTDFYSNDSDTPEQ